MSNDKVEVTGEAVEPKQKRYKGGRPKLEASQKKSAVIKLHCTIEERQLIERLYADFNFHNKRCLSDFLKNILLDIESQKGAGTLSIKTITVDEQVVGQVRIDLGNIAKRLKSLSDNYNQTTKLINSLPVSAKMHGELRGQSQLIKDVLLILEPIYDCLDKLNDYLKAIRPKRSKTTKPTTTLN